MFKISLEKNRGGAVRGAEVTDPRIILEPSVDSYTPPEKEADRKAVPSHVFRFFSKKKAVADLNEIAGKVARLSTAPDAQIHYFLENDFARLLQYGETLPKQTQKCLNEAAAKNDDSKAKPWFHLARVAAGEPKAILPAIETAGHVLWEGKATSYLYGLQKLAEHHSQEATHLMRQIFEKGDLNTRLATFRVALFSPHIGDGKLIGEWFVKLLGAATPEERKGVVEPSLKNWLAKSSSEISQASRGKLAWLSALHHGLQEKLV